ncbi:hypothetical protein ABZ622_37690 [Streptomyces sp. NPDC007164]
MAERLVGDICATLVEQTVVVPRDGAAALIVPRPASAVSKNAPSFNGCSR